MYEVSQSSSQSSSMMMMMMMMMMFILLGVALYFVFADDDSETDEETDEETEDDSSDVFDNTGSFSATTQDTFFYNDSDSKIKLYYHPLTSEEPTGDNVLEPDSIRLIGNIVKDDGTTLTKLVFPAPERLDESYRNLGIHPGGNNTYIPSQSRMEVKGQYGGKWRFNHWVREFLPNSTTYFVIRSPYNDSTIFTHNHDPKRSSKKYIVSVSREDQLVVDTVSTTIPSHVAVFKLTAIESVTLSDGTSVNAHKLVKVECDSNSLFDNSSKKCVKIDTSMSTIGNGLRAYEKGDNYSDWPLKNSRLSNMFLKNHVTCPDGQLISDYFLKAINTGTSNVISIDRTCVPVSNLSSQYVSSFEVEVSNQKNYRNFANNFSINCPTDSGLQKIVYTQDPTTSNLITTYTCQKLATKNPTTRTITGPWKQTGGTTESGAGAWMYQDRQHPKCARDEVISGIDMTLNPEGITQAEVGSNWLSDYSATAGHAGNYAKTTTKCLSHKPFLTQ